VALAIVVDDPANSFALLDERVVVQVRSAPLTHAMLDAAERDLLPRIAKTGPVAALSVIDADSGPSAPDVQERQRKVLGALLARTSALMVTVMLGDTVTAAMSRASGRLLLVGNAKVRHARTIEEGCALVAAAVPGVTVNAVEDAVRALQTRGGTKR
jgi:hypothetical protein